MTSPRLLAGHYEVINRAGAGGMGEVWRARDCTLERDVAIKVLRPELARDPAVVERFRSEAVVLARLNHPNIATLYTVAREGDGWCMVMEYVNGTSLDRLVAERGKLPWQTVVDIGSKALAGIAHAHAAGVIHRDLKPANLMLTPNSHGVAQVKVMDFGIARMFDQAGAAAGEDARLTRAGSWVGTIEYASPEQIRGEAVDGRADLYSLAIVLYELLTGKLPFEASTDFGYMQAHLKKKPASPRVYQPEIPRKLAAVLLRALAKARADRYANAEQFAAALAAVRANAGTANRWAVWVDEGRSALTRACHWIVENPALAAAAALSGVAIGLVALSLRPVPKGPVVATQTSQSIRSSEQMGGLPGSASAAQLVDEPRPLPQPIVPADPPPLPAPSPAPVPKPVPTPPSPPKPAPTPAPRPPPAPGFKSVSPATPKPTPAPAPVRAPQPSPPPPLVNEPSAGHAGGWYIRK